MVLKEKELISWLTEAAFNAKIYDYGAYPIKGSGIWLPYGFDLKKRILEIIRELLTKTNHKEVQLPLLIPKDMLEKEKKHIAGFLDQVFWVTKGGKSKLDIDLALRPTSETAMTYYFKKLIISYKDLPLKVFQIGSIFRYETKATHPLIRVREVTMFKEAFTFHATKNEAFKQIQEAFNIYLEFFNRLGIPVITVERPAWDRFPGAEISIAFDTILPDGKSLQIASIHMLGQSFSKVFDAKFMKENGNYEYVYQTSYGISERVIASLLIHHGDELGVIFLPNLAPIQIVIVPIIYENLTKEILNYSKEIYEILKLVNYRVMLDDRKEKTPGEKFYEWERHGVPLRLEIGPKEIKERTIKLSKRTGEKRIIPFEKIFAEIEKAFAEIENEIKKKAYEMMKNMILKASNINEVLQTIDNKKAALINICENEKCSKNFEKFRGIKFLGYITKRKEKGSCIICKKETEKIGIVCKSY